MSTYKNGEIVNEDASFTQVKSFMDSMSIERQELSSVVDAGKVYLDVQAIGGGNISYQINGVTYVLDCTTGDGAGGKARVELEQGVAGTDCWSVVYVAYSENDGKLKLINSTIVPLSNFATVAYVSLQDHASFSTNGFMVLQRTTDMASYNGQGSVSRAWENTRLVKGGGWWSGVDPSLVITANGAAPDNIDLQLTTGVVYQKNQQSFPSMSVASNGIFSSGMDSSGAISNLQKLTDLNQMSESSRGVALTDGDSIVWTIYANINYSPDDCKMFVVPGDQIFTTDADCIAKAEYAFPAILPNQHRSVGFLIARYAMKYNTASGGTWTNLMGNVASEWRSRSISAATINYPSNYPNNMDVTRTITEAGALAMRVHFSNFETEARYDYARIQNGAGTELIKYDGQLPQFTSIQVAGSEIRIRYTSDDSVRRPGCMADRLEYLSAPTAGVGFKDLRGF